MLDYIKSKITAALAWIYKWVTVLTGIFVGFVSVLPNLINTLTLVDLTPLMGADRAAQVVTGVAILKAIIEVYRNSSKAA